MAPTPIQKSSKNFKIELPGNWTKLLISPESAWSTDLKHYIFSESVSDGPRMSTGLPSIQNQVNCLIRLNY